MTDASAAVFTNTSSGTMPLTHLWDFGDGVTSTVASPTHTYTAGGTYSVTLVTTNVGGTDSVQAAFTVISYEAHLPLIRRD